MIEARSSLMRWVWRWVVLERRCGTRLGFGIFVEDSAERPTGWQSTRTTPQVAEQRMSRGGAGATGTGDSRGLALLAGGWVDGWMDGGMDGWAGLIARCQWVETR